MKIFFDTEFTGLHRNTSLISIGLIAEDGRAFYAEFIDYNRDDVNDWIKENVIDKLLYSNDYRVPKARYDFINDVASVRGATFHIKRLLRKWLMEFDEIEWVSDVCHYDFVLLIDLVFGHALNMPYGKINAACHDINQDIAKYFRISEIEAFDINREEILEKFGIKIEGSKHNALYDAKVIKAIYEVIK